VWHDSSLSPRVSVEEVRRVFEVGRMRHMTHMCDVMHMGDVTWDVTHAYVWHDSFLSPRASEEEGQEVRRIFEVGYTCDVTRMCDVTHAYVWHDACMRVTRLISISASVRGGNAAHLWGQFYLWHDTCVWCDSCICVTWLMRACDTTDLSLRASQEEMRRIFEINSICDMTDVCDVTYIGDVTYDVTHVHVWRDSCTHVKCSVSLRSNLWMSWLTYKTWRMWVTWRVTWLMHACEVWRIYEVNYVCKCGEYRLFYRALLQKRPIILRSLRIVATAYPPHLLVGLLQNVMLKVTWWCNLNLEIIVMLKVTWRQ